MVTSAVVLNIAGHSSFSYSSLSYNPVIRLYRDLLDVWKDRVSFQALQNHAGLEVPAAGQILWVVTSCPWVSFDPRVKEDRALETSVTTNSVTAHQS
jgi:hypothetical protein